MTEQEKKELLDELEKRMDEKYKGCLTREDVATTLKTPREKWFKDENGKKIWENDIIKYHFGEIYAPIKYGHYQNCFDAQKTEHVGFYVNWTGDECLRKDLGYWIDMVYAMPIGNVFDNKELLQEEH